MRLNLEVCAKSRYRQPTPPTLLAALRSSKLPPLPIPTSTFTSQEDSKNRDLGCIPLGGDSTKNSRRRLRCRHGSNCFFDEGNKFHDFEDTESSPDQYRETEIRVGTPLSFTEQDFKLQPDSRGSKRLFFSPIKHNPEHLFNLSTKQSVTALGAEMSPDGGEIRVRYDAYICWRQVKAMDSFHAVSIGQEARCCFSLMHRTASVPSLADRVPDDDNLWIHQGVITPNQRGHGHRSLIKFRSTMLRESSHGPKM